MKLSGKKSNITNVIKQIVAENLGTMPENITNNTTMNYYATMAVIYDLHHKYPKVHFPEDKFDKYCKFITLRDYVRAHVQGRSK